MSRNNRFSLRLKAAALLAAGALPLMGSALINPALVQDSGVDYTTAQVEYGSIIRTMSTSNVTIVYPHKVDVRCDIINGQVAEVSISRTDHLEEGMQIGVLRSDNSGADLAEMQLSLERARTTLEEGVRSRDEAIARQQASLSGLSSTQRQKAQLQLQKMQLERQSFIRRHERSISQMEEKIAEYLENTREQTLLAPESGRISYYCYATQGDSVYYDQVLLTLETASPYLLRIEDSGGEWRYGMEVTLEYGAHNSRSSCRARIVCADNILPHSDGTGYAYAVVEDEIDPSEITQPSVKGEAYRVDNVLLIPKKAASPATGASRVALWNGSAIANRYIRTSLSNSNVTWVVQGLEEGQTLILD